MMFSDVLKKLLISGAIILGATIVSVASANQSSSAEAQSKIVQSTETAAGQAFTESRLSRAELAASFGLTVDDWKKYETIMQGPRGFWSPGLDPLTVLGIEAKTASERTRYAELQARMEFARTEQELEYQRAYDTAFQKLYASVPVINNDSGFTGFASQQETHFFSAQPITVFVSMSCGSKCDQLIKKLQQSNATFDIYVLDSMGDDNKVRQWAAKIPIDPARVKSRIITLNHNKDELSMVAGIDSAPNSKLPLAYIRSSTGTSWQQVKLGNL